jgi:quercetin 2,3-dioxygenase
VTVHANARLYAGLFDGDESAELALDPARPVYVHLVRGELEVNGQKLSGGDAAKLRGEAALTLGQGRDAEVLVFELSA